MWQCQWRKGGLFSDGFGKTGLLYRENQTSWRSKLTSLRSARMGIVDY